MTTLEGRHPLIAIRTRGGKPASLLEVLLIAVVTLAAAVSIAIAIHHNGGTGASQQSALAATRFPANQAHTAPLAPGVRYDGGPEEGTRGPVQVAHTSPTPSALRFEHGFGWRTARGQ
jgi:hypothetical protein